MESLSEKFRYVEQTPAVEDSEQRESEGTVLDVLENFKAILFCYVLPLAVLSHALQSVFFGGEPMKHLTSVSPLIFAILILVFSSRTLFRLIPLLPEEAHDDYEVRLVRSFLLTFLLFTFGPIVFPAFIESLFSTIFSGRLLGVFMLLGFFCSFLLVALYNIVSTRRAARKFSDLSSNVRAE